MSEKKHRLIKQVPLKRIVPDNLQTHFASDVVVQHNPDAFIISFFEAFPPIVLGETQEEVQAAVERIKQVESKCVARIVVTPAKMKEIVQALTTNLNKYIKTFEFNEEDAKR